MAAAAVKPQETPKEGPPKLSDFGDKIDQSIFEQILEMDDDDERDFSKGIVYGFFDQADGTFEKMEKAMSKEDLKELSQLGHFLKGSSATLGLTKVKEACERIQHYGARKDETGSVPDQDEKVSLDNIKRTFATVKDDYTDVESLLRRFYGEEVSTKKPSTSSKDKEEAATESGKSEEKKDTK